MEEIRARLIESAGQEFAVRGFRETTIRHICGRAKANVAAVNYYFGDKERLYIETVRAASQQRAAEVPLPAWDAATPPAEKLRDFVRTIISRMLGQRPVRWETQLMLREVLHPTAACRELSEEYFRPFFETLLGIISELAPRLSMQRRRQVGFSIIGQCFIFHAAREVVRELTPADEQAGYSPEQLSAHIAEFSLAALQSEVFCASASITDSAASH